MKHIAISTFFSLAAYFISSALDFVYIKYFLQHLTFHRYLGFIDTMQLASWLPTILLYGVFGWYLSTLLNSNERKWIVLTMTLVLAIELYFTNHIFTEHTDFVDKAWSYFGYLVPGLSALIGYSLKSWLTKSSSGTTNSAGAPFVAP